MENSEKKCLECGKKLLGRSDKKFCDEGCRASYNNDLYRMKYSHILKINRILKKNHAILESIIISGKEKCPCKTLFEMGFNFDYMTSIEENINKRNSLKLICYDYYYIIGDDGMVSIFECEE